MLIECPTHTPADLRAWALREADDLRHARSARLAYLERRAITTVRRFLSRGTPAYIGTSWGKDSVVTAHLVRCVAPSTLLVHGRFAGAPGGSSLHGVGYTREQNPYCDAVRDEFLSRWPMSYQEVEWGYRANGRALRDQMRRALSGYARFTGIRAAESGVRALSAGVHGESTAMVCRPILRWSTADVFGYLAKHDLPVHPSYAMSNGGEIDREGLRVDTLGGPEGIDRGRRDWENTYYENCPTGGWGIMSLCHNCRHRQTNERGQKCAVNGEACRLLEHGVAISACRDYRRNSDGKRLLVDSDGKLDPPLKG